MEDQERAIRVARAILQTPDDPNYSLVKLRPTNPATWKSGKKHPIYTDLRDLQSLPKTRDVIIDAFIEKIDQLQSMGAAIEGIAPVPQAAVPIASIIANELGLPQVTMKDRAKDHGTGKSYDGILFEGRNYLVIEDLFSTGNSSIEVVRRLREAGACVNRVASIMTYEWQASRDAFVDEFVTPICLTNYTTLSREAQNLGLINEEQLAMLADWSADPQTWGFRHGFAQS